MRLGGREEPEGTPGQPLSLMASCPVRPQSPASCEDTPAHLQRSRRPELSPKTPGFYFAHGQESLLHSLQTQFVETPAGPACRPSPGPTTPCRPTSLPHGGAMQLTHPPKTPPLAPYPAPLGLDPPTPATPRSPWGPEGSPHIQSLLLSPPVCPRVSVATIRL